MAQGCLQLNTNETEADLTLLANHLSALAKTSINNLQAIKNGGVGFSTTQVMFYLSLDLLSG